MALPFIAGIAAGALAVVAWNKRDGLKEKSCEALKNSKKFVVESIEKGKEKLENTKKKVSTNSESKPKRSVRKTKLEKTGN